MNIDKQLDKETTAIINELSTYEVQIITDRQERIRRYKTRREAKRAYHNAKLRYKTADIGLYNLYTGEVINQHQGV